MVKIRKVIRYVSLTLYYLLARYLPYQPFPGYKIWNGFRSIMCRNIFKKCGKNIVIKHGAYFGLGTNIEIGDHSQLGIDCKVDDDLILGEYVLMGPEVIIYSTSHEYESVDVPVIEQGAKEKKPVVVGDDVWIGTRVIIMPGVKVGNHVIIGANSVVTKDVPDYVVVAGVPAKVVRQRKRQEEIVKKEDVIVKKEDVIVKR